MNQIRLSDVTKVSDVLAVEEVERTVEDGEIVEPIGSGNFLYLRPLEGDNEIIAWVDNEFHPESGETIALDSDPANGRFFDETGEGVSFGDEPGPMTTA